MRDRDDLRVIWRASDVMRERTGICCATPRMVWEAVQQATDRLCLWRLLPTAL